jgi:hypothetical protein
MRILYEYSHLGGAEILQVRFPKLLKEIYDVIDRVKPTRTKVSKEKTKSGKLLFAPIDMNNQYKELFRKYGFKELRDTYTIELPKYTPKITGAFKQIDFVRDSVLVEVQFGKYAFMFYDMAKFQYFFNENLAEVGVEIVPAHSLSRQMSSGVSYGEQLIFDIQRLKRHFPAVPVKVILVDV